MCQIIPFKWPCCARVYVRIEKLPSCHEEWPKFRCPSELCIQTGGYLNSTVEQRARGSCWRCKASRAGKFGANYEALRPAIDKAPFCEGLDAFAMDEKRYMREAAGDCWFCGSKSGCEACGSKKVKPEGEATLPPTTPCERRGSEKRKIGYGNLRVPVKRPKIEASSLNPMSWLNNPASYPERSSQAGPSHVPNMDFAYKQEIPSPASVKDGFTSQEAQQAYDPNTNPYRRAAFEQQGSLSGAHDGPSSGFNFSATGDDVFSIVNLDSMIGGGFPALDMGSDAALMGPEQHWQEFGGPPLPEDAELWQGYDQGVDPLFLNNGLAEYGSAYQGTRSMDPGCSSGNTQQYGLGIDPALLNMRPASQVTQPSSLGEAVSVVAGEHIGRPNGGGKSAQAHNRQASNTQRGSATGTGPQSTATGAINEAGGDIFFGHGYPADAGPDYSSWGGVDGYTANYEPGMSNTGAQGEDNSNQPTEHYFQYDDPDMYLSDLLDQYGNEPSNVDDCDSSAQKDKFEG